MTNAMEGLTREIARVTELKTQYEELRGMPGVNVTFALGHIAASLEAAHKAAASGDVVAILAALRDLESKA